jgi:hypothetical protein
VFELSLFFKLAALLLIHASVVATFKLRLFLFLLPFSMSKSSVILSVPLRTLYTFSADEFLYD